MMNFDFLRNVMQILTNVLQSALKKMFLILYNKLSVAKYHPQHRTGGEKTFATINLPQTINQSAGARVQRRTKGLICTHAT